MGRQQNRGININIESCRLGLFKVTAFCIEKRQQCVSFPNAQDFNPPRPPPTLLLPIPLFPTEAPRLIFRHAAHTPSSCFLLSSGNLQHVLAMSDVEGAARTQGRSGGGTSDILPAPDPARSSRYGRRRRRHRRG